MEILTDALGLLAAPQNLLLMIAAVFGGVMVGAAPGLTSTMAIGLLIPMTFGFSQYTAFILMLGIYCGAMYGGSITAILMNVPGTPTAAITAIEGYQMTVKGQGGLALGVATLSSAIGGLISCVVLVTLSLYLAKVATMFGAPEYFSLALFAVAVVFTLSSRSIVKGMIASVIGLLLGTVGIDPVAQYPRFTFGVQNIMIGIPEVPAVIGLFCVAEAFRMAENTKPASRTQQQASGLSIAYRYLPRLWKTILRSSAIGCVVGTLPGTGAMMGSYIAYGEAKRASAHPEDFGKGSVEGVCASESANNAVTGGALIPLLTLGIPGDPNTLMMLGAMTVHGLIPGPTLFREQGTLVYVIFGTMILCNLLILPIGLMLAPRIAKVALIDKKYLMPAVSVLAITGASIGYGHIYYFWISVIFGIVGYIFEKGGFSVLAMAMCIILGPLMERYFRSSLMLPDAGPMLFLSRPLSLLFIVLSVLIVIFGLRREFKMRAMEDRLAKEKAAKESAHVG